MNKPKPNNIHSLPDVMETPPSQLEIAYRWAQNANDACNMPIITLCSLPTWPEIRELVNAHKHEYSGYPHERATDLVIEMHAVAALKAAAEYDHALADYNERNQTSLENS